MNKRRFTRSALACAALLLAAITSQAQPLSNKPIRIVVPFGAGGVADVTSRVVAQKLASQLGQPVIIDNKPGAGGVGAGEAVAKADSDVKGAASDPIFALEKALATIASARAAR